MTLTTLLLMLKLINIYVAPANPLAKDDQTLATCVVKALTARPSALVIVESAEKADAKFTISNAAAKRIHVVGTLIARDGTPLVEVNHVTHGFNHSLCNQADGLVDEMARKIAETAPLILKVLETAAPPVAPVR